MVVEPSVPGAGVKVTEQVAEDPEPDKVHEPEPLNVPEVVAENETVPVGVVLPVEAVSVTVAVHVVGALTAMDAGEQVTLVVVGCPKWAVIVPVPVRVTVVDADDGFAIDIAPELADQSRKA